MHEYRIAFSSGSQTAIFCPAHFQGCKFEQPASSPKHSASRKRKGDELPSEKLCRLSSPRHWDVALVPFPEDFVPLPTPTETGQACPAPWAFPPSLCVPEPRATKLRVLAIAEAGDTVTADHFCKWPLGCRAQTHSAGYSGPSAHSVSTRMHGSPFAELACPLPAADLRQYNAILPPSSQLCCCPGNCRPSG